MKKFGIFAAAFAILASASCMEETIAPETVTGDGASFTATRADYNGATKTVLVDGCKVEWKAGNQVNIFNEKIGKDAPDENSELFNAEAWKTGMYFKTETAGSSVLFKCTDANFKLEQGLEYLLLHPAGGNYYSLCAGEDRYIRFWFGDQDATLGTYNEAYGYCAAKSSDFSKPVTFKNLLPLLKFTVPASLGGRITKITVSGNKGEFVAGEMLCDYRGESPEVHFFREFKEEYKHKNAYTSVSLNSKDGMAAGDYYLVIAPNSFSKGIKVTVTYKDGTTSTRSSSNPVELESSVIYNMGNVGAENYSGPGITELPYVFSLFSATSTGSTPKYLSKPVYSGDGINNYELSLTDNNVGATLLTHLVGNETYPANTYLYYYAWQKGCDRVTGKSFLADGVLENDEKSYYKLTVPLRIRIPETLHVTFGLGAIQGACVRDWKVQYSGDDVNWKDAATISLPAYATRIFSVDIKPQGTISDVLYLRWMPTGTVGANGSTTTGFNLEVNFWGGVVLSETTVPATDIPAGSIYFESFDEIFGGVDYLSGSQPNGIEKLGQLVFAHGSIINSWTDEQKDGLTGSHVAMRPGYVQIGRPNDNQAYNFDTYNNNIGSLVTPKLQAGNINLSFKAMILRDPTYGRTGGTSFINEGAGNMEYDTIIVNIKGEGTFEDGSKSKTISAVSHLAFTTYTLAIKNATDDTQIEFTSPTDKDKNTTWFLDDICVTKAE
ncbi:MAG: hypothetical protein J6A91_00490 [Bacteroidales bacterium]|nr:hypothetical protein [Bacteroidales bacterium]